MNAATGASESPALGLSPGPDLVLILPDDITETETLESLVQAIGKARGLLMNMAILLAQTGALVDDDPIRRALLTGQSAAFAEAVRHINEQIVEQFDLWPQYARWSHLATAQRPTAEQLESP
jgi:hypothetical protein